jgi:hypothetical protein
MNCIEVTGQMSTTNVFILLTYVGMTIQKYKKYRNQIEIKTFSNPMGLQFLCFFSLTPLNVITLQEKYPILIFHIVDRCHLLGMTIQKYKNTKNTETKLKSKSSQIQWVYSFCFIRN